MLPQGRVPCSQTDSRTSSRSPFMPSYGSYPGRIGRSSGRFARSSAGVDPPSGGGRCFLRPCRPFLRGRRAVLRGVWRFLRGHGPVLRRDCAVLEHCHPLVLSMYSVSGHTSCPFGQATVSMNGLTSFKSIQLSTASICLYLKSYLDINGNYPGHQ
jgi:hypothetical protein